jgi:hypothetical protein
MMRWQKTKEAANPHLEKAGGSACERLSPKNYQTLQRFPGCRTFRRPRSVNAEEYERVLLGKGVKKVSLHVNDPKETKQVLVFWRIDVQ